MFEHFVRFFQLEKMARSLHHYPVRAANARPDRVSMSMHIRDVGFPNQD
jgi:hypothetical protein